MKTNFKIFVIVFLGWLLFFYATGLLTAGLHPDLDPYVFLGLDLYYQNGKSFGQDFYEILKHLFVNRFGPNLVGLTTFAFFSKFFGSNMLGIRFFFMLLGASSFFLLYLTGQIMGWTKRASWALPAILMLGTQFWIWYNLCGEPLGVFFSSLTFYLLALAAHRNVRWLWMALLSVVASMASKESFLLLLPAFVLFYIWQLEMINPSWSWKQLVTKALPFAIPVAILFFAELIYLLVYFGGQARGVGVSIDTPLNTYVRTLLDFFATNSFYMYLFSGVFLLVAFNEREKIISFLKSKTAVILLLFFAAILLPQVVLHARAGWVLRYLFPAFFAPAFAIALIFNQLQFHSKVYNYYGLLLLLYIGAEMLPKISDNPEQAFRSLRNYVSTCRHTENIIHSVISRSRKDDWLVIVSNPVQDYVWPMTLKSLFKTLHGKTNIARLIVTFPYEYDPVAQSRIASVAHYNEQFAQLDKNNIQDIVIMPYIERLFLHEHRSWFHPDEWERYQSWLFCHYHRKNHR